MIMKDLKSVDKYCTERIRFLRKIGDTTTATSINHIRIDELIILREAISRALRPYNQLESD